MKIEELDDSRIVNSMLLKIMNCNDANLLTKTIIGNITQEDNILLLKLSTIIIGRKIGVLNNKVINVISDQTFLKSILNEKIDIDRLKTLLKLEIDERININDELLLQYNYLPYEKIKELFIKIREENKSLKTKNMIDSIRSTEILNIFKIDEIVSIKINFQTVYINKNNIIDINDNPFSEDFIRPVEEQIPIPFLNEMNNEELLKIKELTEIATYTLNIINDYLLKRHRKYKPEVKEILISYPELMNVVNNLPTNDEKVKKIEIIRLANNHNYNSITTNIVSLIDDMDNIVKDLIEIKGKIKTRLNKIHLIKNNLIEIFKDFINIRGKILDFLVITDKFIYYKQVTSIYKEERNKWYKELPEMVKFFKMV